MRNVRKLMYFLDFLFAIKQAVMGTPSRTIGRGTAAEGMLRGMLGARLRDSDREPFRNVEKPV